MAARTRYFTSVLGQSDLHGIRQDDRALDDGALELIDQEAMIRVNNFILLAAGATDGATLVEEFMDDSNAIDPIFVLLAQKIAAAEAWRRWEEWNYTMDGERDRPRNSVRYEKAAVSLADDIMRTKTTVQADGSVRTLSSDRRAGPIVFGPLVEGSYFDHEKYIDVQGRQWPSKFPDPYQH